MITFLYDSSNVMITNLVRSAMLNPSAIKVRNRLLDGTYHIQTVGGRVDTITVSCYVDKENKDKIDDMYISDEPIKLVRVDKGKYYVGLMNEKEEWSKFSRNLYETSFNIVVESEGVL